MNNITTQKPGRMVYEYPSPRIKVAAVRPVNGRPLVDVYTSIVTAV